MLDVDLEDPAMRLLANADTSDGDAILFPGHTASRLLVWNEEDADENTDNNGGADEDEGTDSEQLHGLAKLLLASISDQSTVALRSVRDGLAVWIPASSASLPLPGSSELSGLWRVVGEVYSKSGQAFREVWKSSRGGSSA